MTTRYLTKIVAASLLGDGTINKETNKNARYKLRQLAIHKDHLDYMGNRLESITRVMYDYLPEKDILWGDKQTTSHKAYILRTMSHPFYSKFRNRMYVYGHKVVDPHYLTLLDWEFLAIWYMQDGYIENTRKDVVNACPILCTDCFSYADNMLLRTALIEKLGLTWNVRKRGLSKDGSITYRLYLSRKQFDIFRENIAGFIQPSFNYKLLSNAERLLVT